MCEMTRFFREEVVQKIEMQKATGIISLSLLYRIKKRSINEVLLLYNTL